MKKKYDFDNQVMVGASVKQTKTPVGYRGKFYGSRFANCSKVAAVSLSLIMASVSTPAKTINLATKQQQNIIRQLFPLPHQVEQTGKAFTAKLGEFSLVTDKNLNARDKEFIDKFTQNWAKQYKLKLSGKVGEKVTIYIGKSKKFKAFEHAAKQGLIDFAGLAKVKNAPQAYAIGSAITAGKLNIYIAANSSAGIYNALTTFEQILKAGKSGRELTLPEIKILDWPDIKLRGQWGSKLYNTPERLVEYSKMKLNAYWEPFLYGSVKSGKIVYPSKKDIIAKGASLNVHVVPILTHLDCMMRPRYMVYENFRELMGVEGKEKFKNRHPWCFSNPKSQVVLDGIFEAIARDVGTDYIWVWPSEHGYACCCPKCKGDKHLQNVREFKCIMHAYKKAKVIRPSLKMTLITTQGTRKYNLELLKYIPKDVGLDIYDGQLTYKTETDKPVLEAFEPLMKEMRAEGRGIGVVPLFAASHLPANMFFPFNAPQLSKIRMEEFKQRGLERVIGFLPPSIFVQKICGQSMAEFAWNADGRSVKKFLVAYATRLGSKNPELYAEIISLTSPAELMLSRSIRADKMDPSVQRMLAIFMGKKFKWGDYHDILRGFKQNGKLMLPQVLNDCKKAYTLAQQLGDRELITGTALLKQWLEIIDLYRQYLDDKSQGDVIRRQVGELFKTLPDLWQKWIDTQVLSKRTLKRRTKAFYDLIESSMKIIKAGKAANADVIKPKHENAPKVNTVVLNAGDKIFEAEDAVIKGAKVISGYGDGYSGTGYADYQNASGDYIEWKLQIDQSGIYNISFVYALAHGNRPLELKVNGSVVKGKLAFPASGSFSTWTETATVPVKLKSGSNKIRISATGASGPNVDYLKLSK